MSAMRRRGFLGSLVASAAVPGIGWADAGNPAFLAAAREPDGAFALFGIRADGSDVFRVPLPGRGHAAAAHPERPEAVAFARRPGNFALVIDCADGHAIRRLDAPEGRHFYGHGTFVQNGAVLVTTENDIATGRGVLGLWSRDDGYARIGEISSGGVGPHDIRRLPGDVLAVANGGIRTHPASGRAKLNLDRMQPNLAYVTLAHGVEETVTLPPDLRLASIRHLAIRGGLVAFAMQWQGDPADPVPLLGLHQRGGDATLCTAGLAEQVAMQGYAGSVALAGDRIAITSPRGGRVHLYGLDGQFAGSGRRTDICGAAGLGDTLMLTDGLGGISLVEGDNIVPMRTADRAWDNHVVPVGL